MVARRLLKRTIDLAVSVIGLVVLIPVLLLITLACLIVQGRPVLHASTRAGRHSRSFSLYKFRTMTHATDADGTLLPDEQRMTRLGRFIRATSLDELPQFVNILRGDMSLVGPRPLPIEYVERYSSYESRRLKMRPGLTGLAQTQGRNAMSWQKRFAYDVTYVERWTWRMEARILLDTVKVVLGRTGISHGEHTTMPVFHGTVKRTRAQRPTAHRPPVDGRMTTTDDAVPAVPVGRASGLELLAVELERSAS